jgi:hypothetical protein
MLHLYVLVQFVQPLLYSVHVLYVYVYYDIFGLIIFPKY